MRMQMPIGKSGSCCGYVVRHLGFLVVGVLAATAAIPCVAAQNDVLTVEVARRDLRPLGGVTVQVTGAVNLQGVTEEDGKVAFTGVPAGAVAITPARSGFRFEPPELLIPDPSSGLPARFTAIPTMTDLALSVVADEVSPLVGGHVLGVITLRNLGEETATDIGVGFGSLPGLVLEARQATEGTLVSRTYDTRWSLPRLEPGATAEVVFRCRATLPEADVLMVAVIEEMDQEDTDPTNDMAQLIVHPQAAQARLSLALTAAPGAVKVGETFPVGLTIRNEGPHEATQIVIRSYCPPGASFLAALDPLGLESQVVIPRLAAGEEVQLSGALMVRMAGTFTLIANVTSFEQGLPAGAPWPESRVEYVVEPAFSRITLLAFTDQPEPRVGDDVNVMYVARNEGPDTVTGLKLFTRQDERLDFYRFPEPNYPVPPVPGPFVFGEVLPVGAYTYLASRYSVKAAGDLTNYFTVEYQDQLIPEGGDHPELFVPIKTLPADVGLSLDVEPKDIAVQSGDPVTIDIFVHNEGPQAARGLHASYSSPGLDPSEFDEVVHADRVLRPGITGYIDVVEPGETVLVRKHFTASIAGSYTNDVEIGSAYERPDLLMPIARETVRLNVAPGPPPDLAISVSVDRPQVNVGEYAIFIVTVTNRAAEPALGVVVHETDSFDAGFALETVRSYGPLGDDRVGTASYRTIPWIEPGSSYSMSRTMRVRKAMTIPYVARIEGVNGLGVAELPAWAAATEVTGVLAASDMEVLVVPDRTSVKNGDPINFAILGRNASLQIASHIGFDRGASAGLQLLLPDLSGYGYYYDTSRPVDLESSWAPYSEWREVRALEQQVSWISTYAVGAGEVTLGARLTHLDQTDPQNANDLSLATIQSGPATASISLRQTVFPENPRVGDLVRILTEIRNEGPDRVTGLALVEASSANLGLEVSPAANGISGDLVTSIWDSLVRLPALEPGQNFVWQRSYVARVAGEAWRTVRVERFDQTALAPKPEDEARFVVLGAEADLEVQIVDAPTTAEVEIPAFVGVRVRNLGPAVATGVKVAVNVPGDALLLGGFGYGPRAWHVLFEPSAFQTQLLPGESARVGFLVTPTRTGAATGWVQIQQVDQIDPNPANDAVSWSLDIGPAPPIPEIMRVRKVRTDFFDQTAIAEVELDLAALNRLAPFTFFHLERSTNLLDWEYLGLFGYWPLERVTFTDHAEPGTMMRAFRLRQ